MMSCLYFWSDMSETKTTTVSIFGQDVVLTDMKVHATAINEGFLVSLVVYDDEEAVVWAGTTTRSKAGIADVADMVTDIAEEFATWKIEVGGTGI